MKTYVNGFIFYIKYTLIFFCLFLSGISLSQTRRSDPSIFDISNLPKQNLQGSTFRNFELADSFSHLNDTINASKAFIEVDPYHLMYLTQTPARLQAFYSKFSLDEAARATYTRTFSDVFNAPRSAVYKQLQLYGIEDKQLRILREGAKEAALDSIEVKIHKTDSVHFKYLYNYVKNNGWPAISDGSLYAMAIALHDYDHYDFYFPLLRDAFYKKNIPLQQLVSMHNLSGGFDRYFGFQKLLEHDHISFDLTTLLDGELPAAERLTNIYNAIKRHCPAKKIFLVFENSKVDPNNYQNPYRIFSTYTMQMTQKKRLELHNFLLNTLQKQCTLNNGGEISEHDLNSDRMHDKLTLYITY